MVCYSNAVFLLHINTNIFQMYKLTIIIVIYIIINRSNKAYASLIRKVWITHLPAFLCVRYQFPTLSVSVVTSLLWFSHLLCHLLWANQPSLCVVRRRFILPFRLLSVHSTSSSCPPHSESLRARTKPQSSSSPAFRQGSCPKSHNHRFLSCHDGTPYTFIKFSI